MLAPDAVPDDRALPSSAAPCEVRGIHDPGVVLTEALTDAQRGVLQRFVARRFREVYDARVTHFLPRLFGAHDPRGGLVAAFGLRRAADGPLFLEQYLEGSIETAVRDGFGNEVPRTSIAEVGNLAGATPGALRALIPVLTRRLADEGFAYVSFTGAARLCNGFARLGLPLRSVAPARIDRLAPSERADWGRYYDSAPEVMLGDVRMGARVLAAYARHPQVLRAQLAALATVGAP
jgi:hypothetical protein